MPERCEITILVVRMPRNGIHDCSDDALFLPLEQGARRSETNSAIRVVAFRAPVAEVCIKDLPNFEVFKLDDGDRRPFAAEQDGGRVALQQRVG